jgi:hypothetical protein
MSVTDCQYADRLRCLLGLCDGYVYRPADEGRMLAHVMTTVLQTEQAPPESSQPLDTRNYQILLKQQQRFSESKPGSFEHSCNKLVGPGIVGFYNSIYVTPVKRRPILQLRVI